jgi:hypothetical protein
MVKLVVIRPSIKRLEQQKLQMVKLEVISPSIKRLEQQKLQMVKLVVIRPSIKRRTRETTDGQTGGDEAFNKKTGTR